MRLFADTSDIEELKRLAAWLPISGVTTNPAIMRKDGSDPEQVVPAICDRWPEWPVSVEVTTDDEAGIVEQAKRWAGVRRNVVVKIPATRGGYGAVRQLREPTEHVDGRCVAVNFTCCMSASQVMLAGLLGCEYVSLFAGRVADMGYDAEGEIMRCLSVLPPGSQLIVGSVRSAGDVMTAALAGAHVVTVPPDILRKLAHHPRTEETVAEFLEATRTGETPALPGGKP